MVWPAVLADLEETQAAWLRGENSGRGPPAESDEEDGGEAVQGERLIAYLLGF